MVFYHRIEYDFTLDNKHCMGHGAHDKIDRYDINITNFDGERASIPHFVQNCDVSHSPDLIGLYNNF